MKKRFFFWILRGLARAFRISDAAILSNYHPPQRSVNPSIVDIREIQITKDILKTDWESIRRTHFLMMISRELGSHLLADKVIDYEIREIYDRGLPTYRIRATIKLLPAENPLYNYDNNRDL
jgi:hypothetical protein